MRRDLAYYDGLGTTILQVALAEPRPGVFQSSVRQLLVVATPVEIALLAVTFADETGPPPPLLMQDQEGALVGWYCRAGAGAGGRGTAGAAGR